MKAKNKCNNSVLTSNDSVSIVNDSVLTSNDSVSIVNDNILSTNDCKKNTVPIRLILA
jgi:hypothetical protein